jgi:hypothetical protein
MVVVASSCLFIVVLCVLCVWLLRKGKGFLIRHDDDIGGGRIMIDAQSPRLKSTSALPLLLLVAVMRMLTPRGRAEGGEGGEGMRRGGLYTVKRKSGNVREGG